MGTREGAVGCRGVLHTPSNDGDTVGRIGRWAVFLTSAQTMTGVCKTPLQFRSAGLGTGLWLVTEG